MSISETITIDAGPAIAGLNSFAEAAARADEAYAKLGKGGGGLGKISSSLSRAATSMDKAAAKISEAVDKIAASMDKIGASGSGVDRAAAQMAALGDAGKVAAAGMTQAARANEKLAASADGGAAAMDRQAVSSARAGATAKESTGFFSKHKEALLGTAVVLGYSVDKAMKFNAQMTLLQTQAGVSSKQMPQLTKGVLELAGQVGQSPGNLAESLYHVESNMASLGIKAPKALEMVKVAAQGASVGHANLVDVTNALTASVASGIPGVQNMSQAMGVLNATVGSGDMNMQDLADAFGTGAVASVKGYGLNIKDVGASLAVFGDNNIRGAKAGTDLRMAVQSLAVPAKSAKTELSALGLTQTTLAKDMQSGGLLKALDDLTARFKAHGVTAKEQGQVITDLFGKKAGVGLSILLGQMDRFQSKYPDLTRGANEFGKAWSKTLDTPQQKLKNLEAGAQALAITAGNVLMPAASGILGGLGKAFQFIQGDAFASKGLAIGAGGLVAGGLAKGLFSGVEHGLQGLGGIGKLLRIPGADKLAGIGQGGAAGSLTSVASAGDRAAAALNAVGAAGDRAAAGESAAGAAGGRAALGESAAGAGGAGGLMKGIGGKALGAAIVAAIAVPLAGELDKYITRTVGKKNPGAAGVARAGTNMAAGALIGSQLGGVPGAAVGAEAGAVYSLATMSKQQSLATVTGGRGTGIQGGPGAMAFLQQSRGPSVELSHQIPQQFTNTLAQAMGKPVKLPPPDISALTGAKGRAAAAARAIVESLDSTLKKPVKATAPDLSAYQGAAGKARADGINVSHGLAQGIESGKGAAVAAANDVANAVASAMGGALQTHSPSKKTEKIGKDAADGLVVGLEGGKSAVDAAAAALGKNVAKAADIASIDNTVKKLLGDVPKGDTGLTKMLTADQSKLTNLANRRTALEAQIKDAQQISQQAISNANITGAGSYQSPLATAGGPLAASATISGLQSMAADSKAFTQTVAQLKKEHLNATSLNQIVQAGPSALPMAQGLAQGGKQAIAQVNQLEGQIKASAAKLGNTAAGPMYQAGVAAGQGLAQGIKSQLGAVEAAIKQLADAMVTELRKDLKAHSPAEVMIPPGMSIPQGVAAGIDRGTGSATAAMGRMGRSLQMAPYQPQASYAHPAAGGSSGGGGDSHVHFHVNAPVHGNLIHQYDFESHLQNTLNGLAERNWQGGVKIPGRAS